MNAYFPEKTGRKNAFIVDMMKRTFIRPRDYFSAIEILINYMKEQKSTNEFFSKKDVNSDYFNRKFSAYLLSEVKSYMEFYVTSSDADKYLRFFQYLNGNRQFNWNFFLKCYKQFSAYMDSEDIENRDYYKTPEKLLQFLYEANVIGYNQMSEKDNLKFYNWAFREREALELRPQVKLGANYEVFDGVAKALNIGVAFKQNS